MLDQNRGTGVERQRSSRRRLEKLVETRGCADGAMVNRGEPSLRVRPKAQPLSRLPAMPTRAIHLRGGKDELNRPLHHPRGEDREDLRTVQNRLRAEAAAKKWRANQHVLGWHAEIGAIGRAAQRHRLVWHVQS